MDTVFNVARLITTPYKVFDNTTAKTIFSAGTGETVTEDMPDTIKELKVIQVYACDDLIYIDVRT